MDNHIIHNNKKAWEHLVYDWRVNFQGNPQEVAEKIKKAPKEYLRCHSTYFSNVDGKTVASICGSDGRRAVALALLGADATVFDISQPQKEYALELADSAGVKIGYEIGDFCEVDVDKYKNYFDFAYCEGGILHYFHDLDRFFSAIEKILKPNATLILSDYHPFQKALEVKKPKRNIEATEGNYFDDRVHSGHLPYAKYFPEDKQEEFPKCLLRFYTLSEVINALLRNGLVMQEFIEYPKKDNKKIPGEFTIIAKKYQIKYI